MASYLRFENVTRRFGSFTAVNDVTLDIEQGETFSLLGPSGCGKTTLLRMLAGFDKPDLGRVLLDGKDITPLPPDQRPVNTVFQSYALFPHLSVRDNIAFGPKIAKWMPDKIQRGVDEMLELVDLKAHADKKPSQLSGGQKQRVAIARALVNKPKVLLLDEPLAALDLKLRQRLLVELDAIHDEVGITFIYVTHDQEEALTMSDRIAVMNDGKVAQVGSPEDLYDRPGNRFVAGFIGESNFLPAVVRGVDDNIVVAECEGTLIRAQCPSRPASGEKVTLTTRPERLRFADGAWAGTTPQNRLSVTVTEAVFAGERCRYMLQAGNGTSIVLKEPSSATIRRRAVGERAEIAWSVADTILV